MTLYDVGKSLTQEASIFNAIRLAETKQSELAEVILDPFTLKIIAMTVGRSLTVKDITDHLGVSIVTTYNIIDRLVEVGMLAPTEKIRTSTRGRAIGYTATVSSGRIELKDGRLEIYCNSKEGRQCFAKAITTGDNIENIYAPKQNRKCAFVVSAKKS